MTVTATHAPVSGRPEPASRPWREWIDRLAGSDPGQNRFRLALQITVAMGVIFGGEWLFVRTTGALLISAHGARLPAAQAALVHTQHYETVVSAILLGSVMALLTGFGVSEPDARGQLITVACLPAPLIATLALGLAVNDRRVIILVLLAASLGFGTYLRRFGARGFLIGATLFTGLFLGYSLHGAVTESDIGWLSAEIGVGVAACLLVRFTLFYPRPARALRRTQRSFLAQVRKTARLALAVFDEREPSGGPRRRRLHHQLVRLNEAALMIDAQLASPSALEAGSSAHRLHQRIFDIELAVANIARLTSATAGRGLPAAQREAIRRALLAAGQSDFAAASTAGRDLAALIVAAGPPGPAQEPDRAATAIPHRIAGTVVALADAATDWVAAGQRDPARGGEPAFIPSVGLIGGWLFGSVAVSAQASMQAGPHRWDRIRLTAWTRAAIQMTVAASAAIAAGDALSGRRFYWALLAVLVTFMGTSNGGEQARKAVLRVAGTIVGVAAGFGLAHAVGQHAGWAVAVVLLAIFFGFYLMRVNYAFWVIGLVVAVSQLYVQLGEFTGTLLLTRVAETALGAAIAIATATFVFPLRTRHVLQVALRAHLAALATLVGHATGQLLGRDAAAALRSDARTLDSAHHTLITTAQPLRQNLFGELNETVSQTLALAGACRDYGRNLVTDVELAPDLDLDPGGRRLLEQATRTLSTSLGQLIRAVDEPGVGLYTRSAALFDQVQCILEARGGGIRDDQLAIRDLELIDQALAGLAATMNLPVTNYDTPAIDRSE